MFKGGLKPALLFLWNAGRVSCGRIRANAPRRLAPHFHPLRTLLVFATACAAVKSLPAQTIRWLPAATPPAVEVTPTAAGATLLVFAEPAGGPKSAAAAAALPPMVGTLQARDGTLRFEPRFPFARGVKYRAEYRPANGVPVVSVYELPAVPVVATTTVVQIFPSSEALPENQLKFYVQFSAPMSRGVAYTHVRLRDAQGAAIELPFLELDEELWDPTFTRLTLLIDPGRIKRGVKPLEDVGPVFEAGKHYTLTIDPAWPDAEGRPLLRGFVKPIHAQPPDRTPPDPARWKITAPKPGTRDALVVAFGEPLDSALALRMIVLADVAGEATLGPREESWHFVPQQPWRAGEHAFVVQTTIEDLAGNNVGKLFDVDVFSGVSRRVEHASVRVAFVVR